MKKVDVEIIGTRPLIYHSFKIEAVSALTKERSGKAGNDPEEWKNTVLEINNQLYIPGSYWMGCLKNGSKFTKGSGRGSLQKQFLTNSLVLTEISLLDRFLPENWRHLSVEEITKDSSQDVYLDIRGVINPVSKGKNIRYRIATKPGWKTSFSFIFDENNISNDQIKKIVTDSGKNVGIGDARILGYGRFDIEKINIKPYDN